MQYSNISLPFDNPLQSLGTAAAGSNDSNATSNTTQGSKSTEGISVIFYVMLSCFVVVGSVGNALAIYVFASLKQKLTSTIFILTLAGTDFLTCVITIPFTMYMEHVTYHVGSDFVCKFFNFLTTTTVPFSAVVMVAIAVDRYMCICHPFHHWMTIQRARIIIACLLLFVSVYGIIISIHYSIHGTLSGTMNVTDSNSKFDGYNISANQSNFLSSGSANVSYAFVTDNANSTEKKSTKILSLHGTMNNNECEYRKDYIDPEFMVVFRHMYNANYVMTCAIVLILYSLIYRYVISQRKKKLRIKSAQCCLLWNARSIESHHESVEITQDVELSNVNGDRYNARLMSNDEGAENHNNGSTRKCSISKARIERMRVANIKTAFTLFIVNVVFIVAFLPAWLMVNGILHMHVIVFFMHFFYNVSNPLIYAFLNQNFKTELKRILRCGKV